MSNEAFGWYLSGLTDGEGCFHVRADYRHNRAEDPRRKPGYKKSMRPAFRAMFNISMRDDETIGLTAIRNRLGVGRLYADAAASRRGGGNPQIKWEVSRFSELTEIVVPHFDAFPLVLKKSRDFVIWRKCVVLITESTKRPPVGKKFPTGSKFGPGTSRLTDQETQLLLDWIAELKAIRKYKPIMNQPT